jgi:large subunit ribosomal protein L22
VANAEQQALRTNQSLDVDRLRVQYAVVNEGSTLKRFTPAAMGRGTPIMKRTSHVEIRVASEPEPAPKTAAPAAAAAAKPKGKAPTPAKRKAAGRKKTAKAGARPRRGSK